MRAWSRWSWSASRSSCPPNIPFLLLRETEGDRRVLPIFIGGPEATAIAFALEEVETPRPMTHDLFKDVLDELGVAVERVVVTELRDSTFFAELHLTPQRAGPPVSSRPVRRRRPRRPRRHPDLRRGGGARRGRPIRPTGRGEAGDEPDEIVEQFREFIDHVNPEDFGA